MLLDLAQKVDKIIVRVKSTLDGVVIVFSDGSELELCPKVELAN